MNLTKYLRKFVYVINSRTGEEWVGGIVLMASQHSVVIYPNYYDRFATATVNDYDLALGAIIEIAKPRKY